MNRILEKLKMERGYDKRPDGFNRGLIVESELHQTGGVSPMPGGITCDEYHLRVMLGVNFYSNGVQLEEARRVAERSLMAYLYGDTLSMLQRAEQAVWDGDPETVLATIVEIRKSLAGAP